MRTILISTSLIVLVSAETSVCLDRHNGAVALAPACEENDMTNRLQICPYHRGLPAKFGDADILFNNQEIQFPWLVLNSPGVVFCIHNSSFLRRDNPEADLVLYFR